MGDNGKGKDSWDNGKGKDSWDNGKGGWGKDKGSGKGKKGKKPRGPSGPDLKRTRITPEAVTGEVVEWKGKYGWVKPTVDVEHEKFAKHKGKLYVSVTDLVECTTLTPGALAQFHIYEDENGLGAEECMGS